MRKKKMTPNRDVVAKAQMLNDEALEIIAARFRVLGEPSRLKLIRALLGGEKSVGQLTELTLLTQANTSRHLQTLTEAGILGRRKDGLSVIYFIADESIPNLCQHVCGVVQRRHASHAESLRTAAGLMPEAESQAPIPVGKPAGPAVSRLEPAPSADGSVHPRANESFMVSFD
jgi:ArsR family transcriptional regulator